MRGTSGSGKTTIHDLLLNHILTSDFEALVIRFWSWPKEHKAAESLEKRFDSSRSAMGANDFTYKDVMSTSHVTPRWILFDDAQDTFRDDKLWSTLFKQAAPLSTPLPIYLLHIT